MPERCIFTKPDIFHILSLANGHQQSGCPTSTLVQLGNLTRPLGSRRQLLLNSGKVQETKIKLLQNREEEINPKSSINSCQSLRFLKLEYPVSRKIRSIIKILSSNRKQDCQMKGVESFSVSNSVQWQLALPLHYGLSS